MCFSINQKLLDLGIIRLFWSQLGLLSQSVRLLWFVILPTSTKLDNTGLHGHVRAVLTLQREYVS